MWKYEETRNFWFFPWPKISIGMEVGSGLVSIQLFPSHVKGRGAAIFITSNMYKKVGVF